MIAFIAFCIVLILAGVYVFKYMTYLKNIQSLVGNGKDLMLKNIILFSNQELARYIKKGFSKGSTKIKIYYFNNSYITIKNTDSKECIQQKISQIQDLLIEKAYENSNNSHIKNKSDEKILDVWLSYGHSERYRKIFRRELERMLEPGEISNSTFNAIYRRFYKFEK